MADWNPYADERRIIEAERLLSQAKAERKRMWTPRIRTAGGAMLTGAQALEQDTTNPAASLSDDEIRF